MSQDLESQSEWEALKESVWAEVNHFHTTHRNHYFPYPKHFRPVTLAAEVDRDQKAITDKVNRKTPEQTNHQALS